MTQRVAEVTAEAKSGTKFALEDNIEASNRKPIGGTDPKKLIPLLKDPSEVVRRRAAWELGQLRAVRQMEHLVPLLQDIDIQVRGTAVAALGKMGHDAARFADQVAILLKDSNRFVRRDAEEALTQMGPDAAA